MKNIHIIGALIACMLLTGCGQVSAEQQNTPKIQNQTADTSVPAVDDSGYVYCVGSVSKVYSTAAVMQLVDAGKVELDAPVTDYIPEFRMADKRYKDITVRMLMDHTSGIMGSSFVNEGLYNDNDTDRHDHLLDYLSGQRLKADPGKFASYCNDGFGLLELITERVSGMSYTEYARKNISGTLGLENTGTPIDMFRNAKLVPSVAANNQRMETCYCMAIGDGGIYATAEDTALFGASFFTGDQTLLSEPSKNAMATRWNDNEFCDDNGLGWDYVELPRYKAQGVEVVGKGGDVTMDHAHLLVAPDEEISVAVLSNGGSSMQNAMIAQALLDVALAEKGITVSDAEAPECRIVTEIPQAYDTFAGNYFMSESMEGSCEICTVTFPEHKYLHMERTDYRKTTCTDFVLTEDGDFAELAYEVEADGFDTRLAGSNTRIAFEETADGVYIKESGTIISPGLGSYDLKSYQGERIAENPVSEEVLAGYRALEGEEFLLCNDKYSSDSYEYGIARLYLIDKLKGYIFIGTSQGVRLEKIIDASHMTAPLTIPSSASRDILDVTLQRDANGITGILLSNGEQYLSKNLIPTFDPAAATVTIAENAAWFSIPDSIANTAVTVTRPEHSAVYVYNQFGEVIYTTHNKDAGSRIPMPKGGKVLFLGQNGESFSIMN